MNEYLEKYPPLLNVNEVAKLLGITNRTVRNLVNNGSIASIRVGRLIRIPKDKLVDYLENTPRKET